MYVPSKALLSLQQARLELRQRVKSIHAQIAMTMALERSNRARIERSLELLRSSSGSLCAWPALRGRQASTAAMNGTDRPHAVFGDEPARAPLPPSPTSGTVDACEPPPRVQAAALAEAAGAAWPAVSATSATSGK